MLVNVQQLETVRIALSLGLLVAIEYVLQT